MSRADEFKRSDLCVAEVDALKAELAELKRQLNIPETADFIKGVQLESVHQRYRWGTVGDAGKTPYDWFWLIGYLAQKAADAQSRGDIEKAKHHAITTAAALANWHIQISGTDVSMRPGIATPAESSQS